MQEFYHDDNWGRLSSLDFLQSTEQSKQIEKFSVNECQTL